MYRALLDTCVLKPGRQRDFLLQLAAEGAYTPLWGSGILFELDYVLAGLDTKRGRDGGEERRQPFEQMAHAFPGAEINASKDRSYDYQLDDPDDGHVAHAAIVGKVDAIVTDDKRAGFTTPQRCWRLRSTSCTRISSQRTRCPRTPRPGSGRWSRCRGG